MKPRPPAIRSSEYAKAFPDRLAVHRYYRRWNVWRGWDILKDFPTHTEAIHYAQQRARLTCRSCGRVMPYLEACIDGRAYCHPDKGPDCYAETSRTLAIERFATLPSYDKETPC